MAEFTLKRKEPKTLRLNIGEESFQIPLAGSLTPEKIASMETGEGTMAFYREYIPDEIAKTLTQDEWNEISEIWIRESKKASRKTPGES